MRRLPASPCLIDGKISESHSSKRWHASYLQGWGMSAFREKRRMASFIFFFFSSRRRHTRYWRTGVQACALPILDRARERGNVAHLARLQRADEVPPLEQVAVRLVLGEHVLGAVLAHHRDPRLGQRRQVVGRDVLDRRADLDLVADPLAHAREVLADAVRVHHARTTMPHWRPVRPRSRRWEKSRSGLKIVQTSTCLT